MAFTVNVTGETLVPIKYLTSFILGKSLLYAGESPYFPYNPSFMLEKSFVFAWENSCLAPESHQSRLQCLANLKKPCQKQMHQNQSCDRWRCCSDPTAVGCPKAHSRMSLRQKLRQATATKDWTVPSQPWVQTWPMVSIIQASFFSP